MNFRKGVKNHDIESSTTCVKPRTLTKEEALTIFESSELDTFDLLNEAYTVRKHYYGKKLSLI